MNKIKVSFPHIDNYYIPVKYLLSHILSHEILIAPKITSKTIELGSKYSPDFVCTPFKYTLGTMIEALDNGANVLIQAGGGCRYGYYYELQDKILKDLGYNFKLINLVSCGKADVKKIYHDFKKLDNKFNVFKALYYLLITKNMVCYMDKIDDYIRQNIGFEKEKNSFINLKDKMLEDFSKVNKPISLYILYKKYFKKFKKIEVIKPDNCLKVGVIGELYTLMEPFSNYYLEKTLANFNIEIKRFTNANYLLFNNKKEKRKALKNSRNFMKYKLGADASNNIYWTKYLCSKKYDGIIHIKSSFCTPEIGIMPIINKISESYKVPIIFLSFDSNTSEVGLKTRLEAFHDMIEMRKK